MKVEPDDRENRLRHVLREALVAAALVAAALAAYAWLYHSPGVYR